MNELIDISPVVKVVESEYIRLLGYPTGYELKERSLELADWAAQWYRDNGKPWIYAVMNDQLDYSKDRLKIGGVEFSSKKFRDQLFNAGAESAMLVAVSAGKELEKESMRLWNEGKPDEYFFLEVYGSAIVENLITTTGAKFCAWADSNKLAVLPHYSPGYPGWNILDQRNLLKLILESSKERFPGEISVYDTGMLDPKKSLLAVFGITSDVNSAINLTDFAACESCSLSSCQYRRKPYKRPIKQIENVQALQSINLIGVNSESMNSGKNILNKNVQYKTSIKALEKWSDERLEIYKTDDGKFDAKFNYEGTTCSNLGHPLAFEYNIKLSSAEENYIIESLNCGPSGEDKGYTFMCDYLTEGEILMKKIKEENPLLGKPLNEIQNWERGFNPEGCYCKEESRMHKWGIVFEVLHYALVKFENGELNLSNTNEEIQKELNNLLEY